MSASAGAGANGPTEIAHVKLRGCYESRCPRDRQLITSEKPTCEDVSWWLWPIAASPLETGYCLRDMNDGVTVLMKKISSYEASDITESVASRKMVERVAWAAVNHS